jgi:hypothetical protein
MLKKWAFILSSEAIKQSYELSSFMIILFSESAVEIHAMKLKSSEKSVLKKNI